MSTKFGMRRQEDLNKVVKKHAREMFKNINERPPRRVFMKVIVYWQHGKDAIYDSMDDPEFVLQEVLAGKRNMYDALVEYGKAARETTQVVNPDNFPVGISISTETMLADSVVEENEDRRVFGIPILLVGGRTASGLVSYDLTPLAVDDDYHRHLSDEAPPEELKKKLEAVKELATDFMEPFFAGFEMGGSSSRRISVI